MAHNDVFHYEGSQHGFQFSKPAPSRRNISACRYYISRMKIHEHRLMIDQ